VILRMLSLGLGRIEDFPFLEPPDPRAIADGWQQLYELGAVEEGDHARKLTDIGRTMARLPVDVKLARMLVAANATGCLREMLAIASFLGIQDPRERPRTSVRRRTTHTRSSPIRSRSSSASSSCGMPTARRTRSSRNRNCARGPRSISSASCACANGANCTAS
jgi:HrpA-like RNA helicase